MLRELSRGVIILNNMVLKNTGCLKKKTVNNLKNIYVIKLNRYIKKNTKYNILQHIKQFERLAIRLICFFSLPGVPPRL